MTFTEQLKKYNSTLYEINKFIVDAEKLGYGSVELVIKSHDYVSKIVEVKAVKPNKETIAKSISKKIIVGKKERG